MEKRENLWGGRFTEEPESAFFEFNRSFSFDRRLFRADVEASRAHCATLGKAGVISIEEADKILTGLSELSDMEAADPRFLESSDAEDVHSFIESKLADLIGEAAGKLHTGRSRNDQVATAFRIWVREACDEIRSAIVNAQSALLELAQRHPDSAIPGYTHLQKAQPILFAHWCLAYFEMLRRDFDRFGDCRKRLNISPLGSAALAGSPYPVDRSDAAKELGFDSVTRNSLDAVSDRDFCAEFIFAAALLMVYLSRLAEDIILYCSSEFGFLSLSDRVSTGSSIMPQKRNPDSMELVRGKAGRVTGDLVGILTVIKGLPLAYNKDLQEDKESVFDAFDTASASLAVTATVLHEATLNENAAREAAGTGFLNATELADYLARKGMPFREAHEMVGRLVLKAEQMGVELHGLPLETLEGYSELFGEDVFEALSLDAALKARSVPGGTSPDQVRAAIKEAVGMIEKFTSSAGR